MGRRTETTEYLKECIADAMIELMQKTPIDKLKIQEITDLAKVGRMTYFRYFNSKTDVLIFKMVQLWNRWGKMHPFPNNDNLYEHACWFFSFCFSIQNLLELLFQENQHIALLYSFLEYTSPIETNENLSRKSQYIRKYISYGMFGIVEEWIQNHFQESPEELATMCVI